MRYILLYFISFFFLLPIFFINYRLTAFHTLPFDNYYEYVLYLDGLRSRAILEAPTGYRFVFYGTAYCFYKILPLIPLSQLDTTANVAEIRALQALAFTAFLFLHAFFFTVFLLLRNRLTRTWMESVGMAAVFVLVSFYLYTFGVDPLYLFYTLLCLYFVQHPPVLYPLLLFSPVVNEKVPLVFVAFFLGVLLIDTDRRRTVLSFLVSTGVLGLYFLMRTLLPLPVGIYGYQTDIMQLGDRMQLLWPVLTSFKGLYTNWLPMLLLSIVAGLGWRNNIFQKQNLYCHPVILIIPVFFFVLGAFMCTDYSIGRVAMHALPFYVVPIVVIMERM